MRVMIRLFLVGAIFLSAISVQALDVDEKLTVRFLSVSQTKKTVLINRGLEDGLLVGDHAKFFLDSGVIARGVVVKASPSRSVWSLYRMAVPDEILVDAVAKVKIASPVKLTPDETKSLVPDDKSVHPEGVALAPGAEDLPKELSSDEQKELASMREAGDLRPVSASGISTEKTLEVWGLLQFNALSSTSDRSTDGSSSGSNIWIDVSVGIEKYFSAKGSWYNDISLYAILHNNNVAALGIEGDQFTSTVLEYGLGINYHFLADPMSFYKPIVFAGMAFGMGTSTDTIRGLRNNTEYSMDYKGSSTFFSLGVGGKYYIPYGFGVRALLDYYRRSESYDIATDSTTTGGSAADSSSYGKVMAGPRLQLGISYRW